MGVAATLLELSEWTLQLYNSSKTSKKGLFPIQALFLKNHVLLKS